MTFLLKNHPKIFCLPRELNFDRLPGTHIAKRLDHSDHPAKKFEPEGSFHSTLHSTSPRASTNFRDFFF